jgi:DNA-binding response OmpR family regulator
LPEKRILLVEDERTIREVLSNVLRTEGYRVAVAITVAEAMACLDAARYALVISDWRLPDGEGSVVVDRAADMGANTLLMSGYLFQMPGDLADRHETLMKPLRPIEIVAAVERSIGKAIA